MPEPLRVSVDPVADALRDVGRDAPAPVQSSEERISEALFDVAQNHPAAVALRAAEAQVQAAGAAHYQAREAILSDRSLSAEGRRQRLAEHDAALGSSKAMLAFLAASDRAIRQARDSAPPGPGGNHLAADALAAARDDSSMADFWHLDVERALRIARGAQAAGNLALCRRVRDALEVRAEREAPFQRGDVDSAIADLTEALVTPADVRHAAVSRWTEWAQTRAGFIVGELRRGHGRIDDTYRLTGVVQ